jgi:hypothetical protein
LIQTHYLEEENQKGVNLLLILKLSLLELDTSLVRMLGRLGLTGQGQMASAGWEGLG